MQVTINNLKLKQQFSTPEYNLCMNCHWKRLFSLIQKMLKAQGPLNTDKTLDEQTHFNLMEMFQYMHLSLHATLSTSRRDL